jgi:hypothetical protein
LHPAVLHQPINRALAGELSLRFAVRETERLGRLIVRWERDGDGSVLGETLVRRGEDGYAARLPAEAVQPPAVRYWVVDRSEEGEQPVFASAGAPQRVLVFHDDATRIEGERLARRDGDRSSLIASGEWVDFGDRRLVEGGEEMPDHYYRLEAGYAYAFLTTVEEVQLSIVHVRGEAGRIESDPLTGAATARAHEVGTDFGRALITLQPIEWLRLRGSVLLGASQKGFEYGGGGALVLGDPNDVNVSISSEALTTLGFMTALRMGFAAMPRLPMGATVEVSNFPVGDDAGVRLLYDVGYELAPGSLVVLRGGYQARTSVRGGPAAALSVRYAF